VKRAPVFLTRRAPFRVFIFAGGASLSRASVGVTATIAGFGIEVPWNVTAYLGRFRRRWLDHPEPVLRRLCRDDVHLPAQKLAIAVSVTLKEKASMSGDLSTDLVKEIAAYLAPEAPFSR